MGSPFPLETLAGYTSRTVPFKTTSDITINADVVYPEKSDGSPATVLLHYHGGFLVSPPDYMMFHTIVGDRYSFLPYWLVHACAARGWVFVTPDYRLMPESTAQASVEDAADAYKWAWSSLPEILGRPVGSLLVAGSSAGGYLALNTAVSAVKKPSALLLIYGMLDPSGTRYTTSGKNIFDRPPIETGPILETWPMTKASGEDRKPVSAYPISGDPAADRRFALASALHIDALFPDYMTGVSGLAQQIAAQGVTAIPEEHQQLFPLDFGNLNGLPPVMLLHGANDSAVPLDCSTRAAEKLEASGVHVLAEFPPDAQHGFDGRSGDVNVETPAGDVVTAVESLRKAIGFLEQNAAN
ncbi:Alpha/Beta hydrolase protein [Colletotrichum phormii]|uniref:Alpha/Beta hydrolase protein n=1 Tax=Colletotrichum phormii TaxID=359342 RepID=A0AAJ0EBR1_9PEZI|nr:Alpha/Beta hydrolase protein [Colletotrichum phormii]KAK1625365.1 Alpha/Beta hydrolase protein [Colletotrichum phormii]